MRKRRLLLASALTLAAAGVWGCTSIGDAGCESDDDCREGRVCSARGVCLAQGSVGEDAGGSLDAPDLDPPGPQPVRLRSARVYEECEDGEIRARISMASDPFPACDGLVEARVDVELSGALDLRGSSPGVVEFDRFTGGIRVLGCEGSFCVAAGSGLIDLVSYAPGEALRGVYDIQMLPADDVTQAIAGQQLAGDFADLDTVWCEAAREPCRP